MNANYQKHKEFMMNDSVWPSFHSHLHTHCEIMYVSEGTLNANVDGVSYRIGENEAMFILPHQIHSFNSNAYNKGYVMFVSPLILPKHAELMKTSVLENPIIKLDSINKINMCNSIVEYLYECFDPKTLNHEGRRFVNGDAVAQSNFGKSLVESYVSILLDGAVWKKKTASAMNNAMRVLEYCLEHYKEDISVYRIAEMLDIAEHTVTRVFTNILKCNFRKYINSLRLSDVVRKLTETGDPVTDIAKECGFDTLRTFNRVFSEEYGCSPSEYRKKKTT